MFKLSKLVDYAVVVLARMGECPGVETAPCLAHATGIPEPTVAKLLKKLTLAGLATSQRGARGGYQLARPLHAIPIHDVVRAIDGEVALAACVDGGYGDCALTCRCAMAGRWDRVNDAVRGVLASITLHDIANADAPPASPSLLPAAE